LRMEKKVILLIGILLSAIFLGVFFGTMFYTVGTGYAALLVNPLSGSVSGPILGPAWGTKAPWVSVVKIYVATDTLGMWGDGSDPTADFPAVACFSKDQLEMRIDIMVRWSLDIEKIRDLYLNYPHLDYKEKTIASLVRERVRFITKQYTAVETILYRDVIADQAESEIIAAIQNEPSLANALINLQVDLRNIALPQAYVDAIEQKLCAEQQKIQAEFEKERMLILANATAQSKIIEAEGYAQAKIIEAEGIKEAMELIMSIYPDMNSTELLELYLWLQTLKELDVPVIILATGENGVPVLIQPTP